MTPNELIKKIRELEAAGEIDMDKEMKHLVGNIMLEECISCDVYHICAKDNTLNINFDVADKYRFVDTNEEYETKENLSIVNIMDDEGHLGSFLVDGEISKEKIEEALKKEHDSLYEDRLFVEAHPEEYVLDNTTRYDFFQRVLNGIEDSLYEENCVLTGNKVYTSNWSYEKFKKSKLDKGEENES